MKRDLISILRLAISTGVGAALLLTASAAGAAGDGAAIGTGATKRDSTADRQLAPAIVSLETRAGHVTIFAGELGRYYTIVAKDGRVVAERVSADELAANHPEVSAMVDHGFAVQMADLPQ